MLFMQDHLIRRVGKLNKGDPIRWLLVHPEQLP